MLKLELGGFRASAGKISLDRKRELALSGFRKTISILIDLSSMSLDEVISKHALPGDMDSYMSLAEYHNDISELFNSLIKWKGLILSEIEILKKRIQKIFPEGDVPNSINKKLTECEKLGQKITLADTTIYSGINEEGGDYFIQFLSGEDSIGYEQRKVTLGWMADTLRNIKFDPFKYYNIATDELEELIIKEENKRQPKGSVPIVQKKRQRIIPQIFHPKKGQTHRDKIGKIQTRVANLIARQKSLDAIGTDEVNAMLSNLDAIENMPGIESESSIMIASLRNQIGKLLEINPDIVVIGSTIQVPTDRVEHHTGVGILEENQKMILFLEDLLTKTLTYNLSSTSLNGNNTVGDGTFLRVIFRPFIRYIINELLSKNQIDASTVSWDEIATKYEQNVEDKHSGRNSFIKILKGNTQTGHFSEIFGELIGILEIFSQGNYLEGQTEKDKFQNIISTLDKISI